MSLLRVSMPPNALGRVCPPCCGLQHQCIALVGAWELWESDYQVCVLQIHIMAHTAAAEEFSNPPSAHQALLQLNICPMGFLQNSIHSVATSHRSVLPSTHSLPPFASLPALTLPTDLGGGGGGCVPALGLGSSSVPSVALGTPESRCHAWVSGKAATQSDRRAQER